MLGLGMTNAELAENLHVSPFTVRSHIKKIHAKCGVGDRPKLTLIAHQVCYREQSENPARGMCRPETFPASAAKRSKVSRAPSSGALADGSAFASYGRRPNGQISVLIAKDFSLLNPAALDSV